MFLEKAENSRGTTHVPRRRQYSHQCSSGIENKTLTYLSEKLCVASGIILEIPLWWCYCILDQIITVAKHVLRNRHATYDGLDEDVNQA